MTVASPASSRSSRSSSPAHSALKLPSSQFSPAGFSADWSEMQTAATRALREAAPAPTQALSIYFDLISQAQRQPVSSQSQAMLSLATMVGLLPPSCRALGVNRWLEVMQSLEVSSHDRFACLVAIAGRFADGDAWTADGRGPDIGLFKLCSQRLPDASEATMLNAVLAGHLNTLPGSLLPLIKERTAALFDC